jgi:molecular chaperone GrpE
MKSLHDAALQEVVMNDDTKPENMFDDLEAPAPEEAEPSEADLRDEEIENLRQEAGQLKDQLLRTLAEMDNLRKRSERERAEATLYAATNFARDILNVSDNLTRALDMAHADALKEASEPIRNLIAGVEVTHRELLNVFERHGIKRIEPKGEKFDPHFHQAVFEVPSADVPPGTVVEVLQAGFTIGDRVLRPAMVGVARAPD